MAQSAVASGTSSVLLLAANAQRKGVIITNSDANRLHVLMDDKAATTTTSYSFSLAQNENANPLQFGSYKGAIYGIWAADGSGHALVTELL